MERTHSMAVWAGIVAVGALGCGGPGGGPGGGRGGRVVENSARLVSTSLASPPLAVGTPAASCGDDAARCTPENVSGDLCYAILGLGELGGDFFSMTWLAPESTFPEGPRSGTCSTVQFDLQATTSVNGMIEIPDSEESMPARQDLIRAELMFNYVDVRFTLPGPLAGSYVVRTVYATSATAPDVAGTMALGDKLVRAEGESTFRWCNAAGCDEDRAAVAAGIIQDATVVDYAFPGDGNPDYVNVTANFLEAVPVSYALLQDPTRTWTLDFSVSDAIVWSVPPSEMADLPAMLDAFRLKFGPNRSTTYGETDDGIRATLTLDPAGED